MAIESLRLDHLPAEIIRNIASLATISSVLSLSATCQAFRANCWDHFIFREIIERHRKTWDVDTFAVERLMAQLGASTASWAQYALADERANELKGGLDSNLPPPELDQMIRWMPHLIVANHPFITSSWLALKLSEILPIRAHPIALAFCYAAAMLSTNDDGNDMAATAAEVTQSLKNDIRKRRTTYRTCRAIGYFAVLLRQAIRHGQIITNNIHAQASMISPGLTTEPIPHPPSTVNIPFKSCNIPQGLPIPFVGPNGVPEMDHISPWDFWLTGYHVDLCLSGYSGPVLHDPEYLTSSTWTGYYSDHRFGHLGLEFYPMHDVKFSPPSASGDGLDISATGWDSLSRFHLVGSPDENGGLALTKRYVGGHSWEWQVSRTPFGLFGAWGRMVRPGSMDKLGAVWLWKKDWTRAPGQQDVSVKD